MHTPAPIILADGKPAIPGEKFYIWPDPTGRLGEARLWPHIYDFLCHEEFPPNWMESIGSFNESQLVRAFEIRHKMFVSIYVHENWPLVLDAVRRALCSISRNATMAFLMYPNDDASALLLLDQLNRGEAQLSSESFALPDLHEMVLESNRCAVHTRPLDRVAMGYNR